MRRVMVGSSSSSGGGGGGFVRAFVRNVGVATSISDGVTRNAEERASGFRGNDSATPEKEKLAEFELEW
ncbi:hypothetical protein VTI74DRAFT_9205 [Chaetomium olivicolor]